MKKLRKIFQSTPPVKAATAQAASSGCPRGIFQSTPPVKAATYIALAPSRGNFISIHAAREGGDAERQRWKPGNYISIHAAREGGDADHQTL